jgi:SAM-dependent methyltransferase
MVDEAFWNERYLSHGALWSGQPNEQLVREVSDLAPGIALDVGCGEGADAIWLAAHGWRVTAVDFSTVALQRGAARAADTGAEGIEWLHQDLTEWEPPAERFDLVSVQYLHVPPGQREPLFGRLARAVAPGGSLLIVGHHPSDLQTSIPRPAKPELFFTADEVAGSLEEDSWQVITTAARERQATDPHGNEVAIHDSVLRARRR